MGRALVSRRKKSSYKARGRLKSVIRNEIQKNENKKVETKRLLGLLGQTVSRGGRFWSMFGDQSGITGATIANPQFEISLFQGVSAVGTNQTQFENVSATSMTAVKNYPSNMNLSMIGDECYLKSASLKYRLVNNGVENRTARVCVFELYDILPAAELEMFFEYAHVNYKSVPSGALWSGGILSSVNRRRVKRIYHDRTYNVTAANEPNAILSRSVFIPLNKKLIAPVLNAKQVSGFSQVKDSAGDTPLPTGASPYPETQQKELLTPHIYIVCFTDEVEDDPELMDVEIQACWTVRYTDM